MASISVPFLSSRAFPSHSAKTHLLHFIISQRSPSLFSNQNFTKASSSSRISIGKGFQSSGMALISGGLLRRKVQAQGEYSSGDEAVPFDSEDIAQEAFAWSSVILPFLFPALGGLLFGYDIGATSGATISLQSAELSGTTWFNLSTIELGLVVSGSLYGALLGSLLVYPIADFLGRRRELIAAAVLYMLGALVTGTASNLGILILGRLLYGIGIGLVSVTFFVRYA